MNTILKRPESKTVAVGLKAFFEICSEWQLDDEQQIRLLGLPDTTFYTLKKKATANLKLTANKDTLERISYILGIYKDLHILFHDAQSANSWVKKPNNAEPFEGIAAIDRMSIGGNVADLFVVRRYLDEQIETTTNPC